MTVNENTKMGLEAENGYNLKYIGYLVTTLYKATHI